ncbi:MAG TPA: ABC transporter permease [Pirellulales bacterium]|nr:ABC transporter permease [Pirellulales bacterium]
MRYAPTASDAPVVASPGHRRGGAVCAELPNRRGSAPATAIPFLLLGDRRRYTRVWFLTLVIKNLFRRRQRSLLTTLGIALAVTAVVSLVGISDGFEQSYLDLYAQRGIDLVVQRSGRSEQLASGLDQRLGGRIRRLPGVREVIGGMVDVVSLEEDDPMMVIVNGWPADCPLFDRLTFLSGRSLTSSDRRGVLLGKVLAGNLDKRVGDSIELYGRAFEVVGIFESYNVYENGAVVMLLDVLQKETDRPGEVSGFTVEAEPGAPKQAIDELKGRIEKLEPRLSVLSTSDFVSSIAQIRAARAMAWLTSTVALILGGIGVLNTMAMSVFERTQEFGVLRAVGWRRGRILTMILSEALLLALFGALLGSVGGVAMPLVLSHVRSAAGVIEGRVAPAVVVEGIAIALSMGVIGAIYPAYLAASLRPVEAMRQRYA